MQITFFRDTIYISIKSNYVIERCLNENITREQQLMVKGMDMLLKRFNQMPDSTTVTVEEIISASNDVYDEIVSVTVEEEHINL